MWSAWRTNVCRFAAYLGPPIRLDELIYQPMHSIIDQSSNAREGRKPLNGDGFGVGWYVPKLGSEPALYRNLSPAWADTNMQHIAPRVETPMFFAHVRGASPGMNVQTTNCHPFQAGDLLFMHNGHVRGFNKIMRPLRRSLPDEAYANIEGTTDSEHLFALIQAELGSTEGPFEVHRLGEAVEAGLARIEALKAEHGVADQGTIANLALTDGRSLVALRWASATAERIESLYVSRAGGFACEDGKAVVVDPDGQGAVLVSSEQMIEQDVGLDPLPPHHMLLVSEDGSYKTRPVEPVLHDEA